MNLKCLFGHKWIMAERPSKPGDFKEGWSPMYFYEMCTRCGKQKNDSPFTEKTTKLVEEQNDRAYRLKESLQNSNRK